MSAELADEQWTMWSARIGPFQRVFDDVRLRLSAREAAHELQCVSRREFERLLRARGLPPYPTLRNWYYVIRLLEIDESGVAISRWLLSRGRDPATVYRFVRRTTGTSWRALHRAGIATAKLRAMTTWDAAVDS
jgi:hypothetical protein